MDKNTVWERFPKHYRQLAILALALALLPVVVRSPYLLSIMIFIALYTILTLGLCLLMGYAGQV